MTPDFDVVDALAGFAEDLHSEGNFAMRLHDAVAALRKERDELRAEVERLRSLKPIGTYSLDWNHEQERKRLTAERDAARAEAAAYKQDFEAELRGNAELRRQYGARGDETMFGFHARVAREREEALAEVARLRWGNEMACENTPTKGCECPGCGLARERAERGEDGP